MKPIRFLLLIMSTLQAQAGQFAEGLSSTSPDQPAQLQSRMFTIHTLPEACAGLPAPAEIETAPSSFRLAPGDRIYRGRNSRIKVWVRNDAGALIQSVPIVVNVLPFDTTVFMSQSSWDYIEAVQAGIASLEVVLLCPEHDSLRLRIPVIVE